MGSLARRSLAGRARPWVALALCAALLAAGAVQLLVHDRPAHAEDFGPLWLPLAAAALAAAAFVVLLQGRRPRLGRALGWGGLLLLLWTASGLPLDLLRSAGSGAAAG